MNRPAESASGADRRRRWARVKVSDLAAWILTHKMNTTIPSRWYWGPIQVEPYDDPAWDWVESGQSPSTHSVPGEFLCFVCVCERTFLLNRGCHCGDKLRYRVPR